MLPTDLGTKNSTAPVVVISILSIESSTVAATAFGVLARAGWTRTRLPVHLPHFLLDLALTLAAAAVVVLASRRLRLPAIVGLLLTGMLLGPSGLALVAGGEEVEVFAEIGVVALLFTLGLEFSRDRVRRVGRPFLLAGPLQLFGTAALVAPLALLFGMEARPAIFLGFLIALSSTALVLRIYAQRRELEAPHGRIGLGVLLFQDLMLAPILAIAPLLAGLEGGGPWEVAVRFGTSAVLLAGVFLVARFVVPPFLGRLIGGQLQDIFLLAAVATCLGLALLTAELGFSAALGAFLAGVLLAESDYSHQVAAEMAPFRDVFTNFFFVSVGMLVDLEAALARLPVVLALTVSTAALKAVVAGVASLAAGLGSRAAITAGLGLAQIGEFSFVLATVGRTQGLLGDELYQVILATSMLTLLLTPGLASLGSRLGRRLGRRAPDAETELPVKENHVVLVGYGLNGRHLGRVLSEARIPWVAVDLDRAKVRDARRRGEPLVLGDGSRRGMLEHCHIETARVVVFAIPDPWALRQGIGLARQLHPGLFVLARTRRVDEIDELAALGADEVIAEELEASIELVTRVLQRYHVPRNVIDAEIRLLRADRYEMLRRSGPSGTVTQTLLAALEQGTTEIFRVEKGGPAAGKTLAELDLRRVTGASVIAVVRDGAPRTNPPPGLGLQVGDDLVLVGGHAEIEAAFRLLGGRGP